MTRRRGWRGRASPVGRAGLVGQVGRNTFGEPESGEYAMAGDAKRIRALRERTGWTDSEIASLAALRESEERTLCPRLGIAWMSALP